MRTTQLIQAVQSGHMRLIGQLINGGAQVNAINALGRTATHYAVSNNNLPALKLLLSNGADTNLADNAGNTPLDVWHVHENKEILALLHAAGAKPLDLWQAAANNDRLSAERLLAVGADAKAENDTGKVPFEIAIEAEHYTLAAILLKAAVGINGRDKKGWTPLHWAVFSDAWDLVREFIREGANLSIGRAQNAFDVATLMKSEAKLIEIFIAEKGVDATVGWGRKTLLMHASERRQTELVKLLIENNADLNIQDNYGETALIYNAKRGQTEIVKLLIDNNADLNIKANYGETALMRAARMGRTETVKLLIENKADLNITDKAGRTALIYASMYEHIEIVKLLIENKADLNITNSLGETALMHATGMGRTETVKLLIENKADPNITTNRGETALMRAAEKKGKDIFRLLIKHGADKKSYPPLHQAIMNDDWDLVQKLIREGADISSVGNLQNALDIATLMESEIKLSEAFTAEKGIDMTIKQDGTTMLMLAAKKGNTEMAELLIKHGANLNIQSNDGDTALIWAANKGYTGIAELLIKHGADLNIQNSDGNTALTKAYYSTHYSDIVKLLIKHDADPNIQNNKGNTALIIISSNWGATHTIEYLIKHGADQNIKNMDGNTALDVARTRGITPTVNLLWRQTE